MSIKGKWDDDAEIMIDAAYEALAERHPEIKHGDVEPLEMLRLLRVMREAAQNWVEGNSEEE